MSMFGPRMGTWSIYSESDPRWRASGRGSGLVSSGGPLELHEKLAELKRLYGEPPKDCEVSFMKD